MRPRFAGMLLNALLAGQMAFGAAAVLALAMKEEPSSRIMAETPTLTAAAPADTVVR